MFYEDDGGFSTLGMVVALLVTLALVFSTAQVYRVMSASADVQDVADAAALAAENEVAEFMIAVRLCDAVSLSLSLTALVAFGIGTAALCVPAAAEIGDTLLAAGKQISTARNTFAKNATKGLNAMQKALPFLAAAQAMSVCLANSTASSDASYFGIALLVNSKGEEIEVPQLEGTKELEDQIDAEKDDIKAASSEAEEMANEALEAKQIAYQNDCGNYSSYCMSERAESLAGLRYSYTSFDAWNFSVALNRAKAYYQARLESENPSSYSSTEEQANSELRKRFYEYAVGVMSTGYAIETTDSFDAYFPSLPANISQMKETVLYSEARYPVTESGDTQTMHAYAGCPNAAGATHYGSLADLDEGDYEICPLCKFELQSMGHVAAATSSTATGFEHYYTIVAEQAQRYQKAKSDLEPTKNEVKSKTSPLLEKCKNVAKQAAECRISAEPPGSYGAIALVVNTQSSPASRGFENAFVSTDATLGARAAISGATMIEDESTEGRTVISSLLDNVKDKAGIAGGLAGIVLDIWSALLSVYGTGQEALNDAIVQAIRAVSFNTASGLGEWASQKFRELMEEIGLQPAELNALKPVTVNSGSVAEGGSDVFAAKFLSVKRKALLLSSSGTELFSSLAEKIGSAAFEELGVQDGCIEIAEIQLLGSYGPSIPITVPLPQAAVEAGTEMQDEAVEALRTLVRNALGIKVWE